MCSVLPRTYLFKAQKPIGKTDIYNVLATVQYGKDNTDNTLVDLGLISETEYKEACEQEEIEYKKRQDERDKEEKERIKKIELEQLEKLKSKYGL